MTRAVLLFSSNVEANHLVAGIPAAVRAGVIVHQSQELGSSDVVIIAVPGGWQPTRWAKSEFARLLPNVRVAKGNPDQGDLTEGIPIMDGVSVLCGEPVVLANQDAAVHWLAQERQGPGQIRLLNTIGKDIVRATGKTSDGLVSRYLNRPISRAISNIVLKIPGVTPIHATGLAAFTAVLMAACLLFGSAWGLIAGALLFHAASVIDGVDGEIARATKRSSQFGAKLDTIIDGITNLAFLSLASLNLWMQGQFDAATYGAVGLGLLATGLTALGLRSIAMGGPFTFDAVKNNFNANPSKVKNTLASITSRDVYALVFALTFALGFAEWMLLLFALAAGIWLITISTVLLRTTARQS
ncbi:MAG: CDP-alcohol phosphatidyltransferase family protein [Erythrobacter sp.]|uniref:CDP-alcohol phosphatidyltransferase family protein n=1 Tax=Erythrobacter sp. TaxID=1042 RepID=UPI0032647D8A